MSAYVIKIPVARCDVCEAAEFGNMDGGDTLTELKAALRKEGWRFGRDVTCPELWHRGGPEVSARDDFDLVHCGWDEAGRAYDEIDRLRAEVDAIRALHTPVEEFRTQWCGHCTFSWPCATAQALNTTDPGNTSTVPGLASVGLSAVPDRPAGTSTTPETPEGHRKDKL